MHWINHMNKIKNLCINCQLKQRKDKYSHFCQKCFDEKVMEDYKNIDVDVQANKYF